MALAYAVFATSIGGAAQLMSELGYAPHRRADPFHGLWVDPKGHHVLVAGLLGDLSLDCRLDRSAHTLQPAAIWSKHVSELVHDVTVHAAFSRDGSKVAAVSHGGLFRVWRTSTGELIASGRAGPDEHLLVLEYAPDGALYGILQKAPATTRPHSHAPTLCIQRLDASDRTQTRLDSRLHTVTRAAFSLDGAALLIANDGQGVELWDLRMTRRDGAIEVPDSRLLLATFTDSGTPMIAIARTVTGNGQGSLAEVLVLRDVRTGVLISSSQLRDGARCLGVSPNGTLFAAGALNVRSTGNDATIQIRKCKTGDIVAEANVPAAMASCACFSRNDSVVALCQYTETIDAPKCGNYIIWPFGEGKAANVPTGHVAGVGGLSFAPDRHILASVGYDQALCIWNRHDGTLAHSMKQDHINGGDVRFSPDGRYVVATSGIAQAKATIWSTRDYSIVAKVAMRTHYFANSLSFSPDGRFLAVGAERLRGGIAVAVDRAGTGGSLQVVDMRSLQEREADIQGRTLSALMGKQGVTLCPDDIADDVTSVAFSRAGDLIASSQIGAKTSELVVRNPMDCTTRSRVSTNGLIVRALAANRSGDLLAGIVSRMPKAGQGSARYEYHYLADDEMRDRNVHLWSAANADYKGTLDGAKAPLTCLSMARSGGIVAAGCLDGSVLVWNVDMRVCLEAFQVSDAAVLSICMTDDARVLATGSSDGSIRLWDISGRLPVQDGRR